MSDTELLKQIIDETKYNNAQIASMLGTSRQFISLVLKGKSNLSIKTRSELRKRFPQFFPKTSVPDILTFQTMKQFRLDSEYTQEDFATKLGISQSMLAQIESGKYAISKKIENDFYSVFSEETCSQTIYYCPEVTIPNNFTLPKKPEVIEVDKRLLQVEKGLSIDYRKTYIVTVSGDTLSPEYSNNDRVLLDTSHTSFKDGYIYFVYVNNQPYVRRVNVSPNNVKCIPFNDEQDAFYIDKDNCEIVGMILPRIRL